MLFILSHRPIPINVPTIATAILFVKLFERTKERYLLSKYEPIKSALRRAPLSIKSFHREASRRPLSIIRDKVNDRSKARGEIISVAFFSFLSSS